jgi:hypothetical protein
MAYGFGNGSGPAFGFVFAPGGLLVTPPRDPAHTRSQTTPPAIQATAPTGARRSLTLALNHAAAQADARAAAASISAKLVFEP